MSDTEDASRNADITFRVTLDADRLPAAIEWSATDAPGNTPESTRAVLLSVWNGEEKKAMTIDLWTKDMLADEMKVFVVQSLMTLADTLERATGEREGADEVRSAGRKLAEKLGLVS